MKYRTHITAMRLAIEELWAQNCTPKDIAELLEMPIPSVNREITRMRNDREHKWDLPLRKDTIERWKTS